MPPAGPAHPDLLQQDGPREPRHVRDRRRDRRHAGHRRHPGLLADRRRAGLRGLLRCRRRPARTARPRRPEPARRRRRDRRPRRSAPGGARSRAPHRRAARGGRDGPRADARARPPIGAGGPHDADLVRIGDQLHGRAGTHEGNRRLRSGSGAAVGGTPPDRPRGEERLRLRLQGAGEHGSKAPRPGGLPSAGLGALQARHEADACPHRKADGRLQPGAVPRRRQKSRRGGLGGRHHRHPQPWPAAHRRHPHRRRGASGNRHSVLRAGASAILQRRRPDEGRASGEGADAVRRGGSGQGVQAPNRRGLHRRRGWPAAIRRPAQPHRAGIRAAGPLRRHPVHVGALDPGRARRDRRLRQGQRAAHRPRP